MNAIVPASLQHFLRTARFPALPETLPTFFSIAGIGHRELPLSNTYAFFFRSDAPHRLGSLFREALLDVIHRKEAAPAERPTSIGPTHAAREYPMNLGQALDLLVHDGPAERSLQGASFVLLIENKVNHWVANNLTNYWASIPNLDYKVGIVLGKRAEAVEHPWLYITHLELARAVELRLGPVVSQVHPRYLPVLLHFLDHLKQMSDTSPDAFTVAFDYAQRHRSALAQAQQLINSITPAGLAATVAEAFGPAYLPGGVFSDRLDIRHAARSGLRYIVFYGDILDLAKPPSFAITFYAGGSHKGEVAAWRAYLTNLPEAREAGIGYLPWLKVYNELVMGKVYPFLGTTLDELTREIATALATDWQPLEPKWLAVPAPPTPEA